MLQLPRCLYWIPTILQTLPFLLVVVVVATSSTTTTTTTATHSNPTSAHVSIRFYGEAQCPFCRKFVVDVWDDIWNAEDLHPFIMDYDFIAWGNAYFATQKCGTGPYSATERQCWYQHCIVTNDDNNDDECFGRGNAIYQHGEKEGQLDIYETCVKEELGLDVAVDFMVCVEGPNMEDDQMSARDLMEYCMDYPADVDVVQECFDNRGHDLEVANAKRTPVHPGVPYVLVDDKPLDDPFQILHIICDSLEKQGVSGLESCSTSSY